MLNISYKPQKISPKSRGSVRQLLHEKIRDAYIHPQFVTDVVKPLQVDSLFDQEVCRWPAVKAVVQWLECWTQSSEPRYKSCGSVLNIGQVCSFYVAPVHSYL